MGEPLKLTEEELDRIAMRVNEIHEEEASLRRPIPLPFRTRLTFTGSPVTDFTTYEVAVPLPEYLERGEDAVRMSLRHEVGHRTAYGLPHNKATMGVLYLLAYTYLRKALKTSFPKNATEKEVANTAADLVNIFADLVIDYQAEALDRLPIDVDAVLATYDAGKEGSGQHFYALLAEKVFGRPILKNSNLTRFRDLSSVHESVAEEVAADVRIMARKQRTTYREDWEKIPSILEKMAYLTVIWIDYERNILEERRRQAQQKSGEQSQGQGQDQSQSQGQGQRQGQGQSQRQGGGGGLGRGKTLGNEEEEGGGTQSQGGRERGQPAGQGGTGSPGAGHGENTQRGGGNASAGGRESGGGGSQPASSQQGGSGGAAGGGKVNVNGGTGNGPPNETLWPTGASGESGADARCMVKVAFDSDDMGDLAKTLSMLPKDALVALRDGDAIDALIPPRDATLLKLKVMQMALDGSNLVRSAFWQSVRGFTVSGLSEGEPVTVRTSVPWDFRSRNLDPESLAENPYDPRSWRMVEERQVAFTRGSDRTAGFRRVIIVVDKSESTEAHVVTKNGKPITVLDYIRMAAASVVAYARRASLPVTVIAFDDNAEVIHEGANLGAGENCMEILKKLDSIESGNNTSYGAALSRLESMPKSKKDKSLIVFISDGEPTDIPPEKAVERMINFARISDSRFAYVLVTSKGKSAPITRDPRFLNNPYVDVAKVEPTGLGDFVFKWLLRRGKQRTPFLAAGATGHAGNTQTKADSHGRSAGGRV